jgi:acetylornithine deacetylase
MEFVSAAVSAASVTGEEELAAAVFADWFVANGFEVETDTVDPAFRDRFPALAHEVDLERRPNVYGWWRGARSGRAPVVLNGHIDVVPAPEPDQWEHAPFGGVREGGRVWGRGSADMKGGIASAMFAVRALRDEGVELDRDLQVQCVMAEETGGLGAIWAIESQPRPSGAIVLEPTDCVVAPACGGIVQFDIEVAGRPAHTAVSWLGVSAMEKLWRVYTSVREFVEERNARIDHPLFRDLPAPAPFGIGTFEAGEWRSTIPRHARMSGRIGVMPGETIEEVRGLLRAAVAAACEGDEWLTRHPPVVNWIHEGFPAWETPAHDPLVASLAVASEAVGGTARLGAVTYGSDAGHFAAAGIPVVLFGPGRISDAHLEDEYIEEDQLQMAAEVLAVALLRLAADDKDPS